MKTKSQIAVYIVWQTKIFFDSKIAYFSNSSKVCWESERLWWHTQYTPYLHNHNMMGKGMIVCKRSCLFAVWKESFGIYAKFMPFCNTTMLTYWYYTTMHTMLKRVSKSGSRVSPIISNGYRWSWPGMMLFWEQEVGGSNPLAPTNDFNRLYWYFGMNKFDL